MQNFIPIDYTPWHIVFGTYGARLHGDARPTVDKTHNIPGTNSLEPNPIREASSRGRFEPLHLSREQCAFIERIMPEIATRGGWHLRACGAASNHVHVLLDTHMSVHGEKVRRLIKRWLGQGLSKRWPLPDGASWWAEEGSNTAIQDQAYLENAFIYVDRQRTTHRGVSVGAEDGPARA